MAIIRTYNKNTGKYEITQKPKSHPQMQGLQNLELRVATLEEKLSLVSKCSTIKQIRECLTT